VTSNPIRRDPDLVESGETENKRTGNRMSKQKNGEKEKENKIKKPILDNGIVGK
jgi:hypothetical protein